MIRFLAPLLIAFMLSGFASAQFGPKPDTPRSAQEIYADRSMDTAATFAQGSVTDTLDRESRTDPERAQFWFNEARNAYTELCENRSSPKDEWARNCYKLAGLYLRGQGVAQDYTQARNLNLDACEQGGHVDACLQQAYTDHTGNAGETDWPRARSLYERACGMGAVSGCAGLANMLYRAQGGPADRSRATRLLQDACADEYEWACERLTGFGLPVRTVR